MTDWKPGDIALCVMGGSIGGLNKLPFYPEKGKFYTVEKPTVLQMYGRNNVASDKLALILVDGPVNSNNLKVWSAARFIKVSPEEVDEFDQETIELYNKQPEKEPV